MNKYEVNITFVDKDTYDTVKEGTIINISKERYEEIVGTLGEEYLTKVSTKKEAKEVE